MQLKYNFYTTFWHFYTTYHLNAKSLLTPDRHIVIAVPKLHASMLLLVFFWFLKNLRKIKNLTKKSNKKISQKNPSRKSKISQKNPKSHKKIQQFLKIA